MNDPSIAVIKLRKCSLVLASNLRYQVSITHKESIRNRFIINFFYFYLGMQVPISIASIIEKFWANSTRKSEGFKRGSGQKYGNPHSIDSHPCLIFRHHGESAQILSLTAGELPCFHSLAPAVVVVMPTAAESIKNASSSSLNGSEMT
jgi:hypothetical protein